MDRKMQDPSYDGQMKIILVEHDTNEPQESHDFQEENISSFQGRHRSDFQDRYSPAFQKGYNPTAYEGYNPAFQEEYNPAFQEEYNPAFQEGAYGHFNPLPTIPARKSSIIVSSAYPSDGRPTYPSYAEPNPQIQRSHIPWTYRDPLGSITVQPTGNIVTQAPIIVPTTTLPTMPYFTLWILLSIFATFCCGWIPGLIGLCMARQAQREWQLGQTETARGSLICTKVSLVISLLVGIAAWSYVIYHYYV